MDVYVLIDFATNYKNCGLFVPQLIMNLIYILVYYLTYFIIHSAFDCRGFLELLHFVFPIISVGQSSSFATLCAVLIHYDY